MKNIKCYKEDSEGNPIIHFSIKYLDGNKEIQTLDTPYFQNSELFSPAAKYFEEHGFYTEAPSGSLEHTEFWDLQEKRSVEGYEVGGIRITGDHYFYLNFTRMKKSERKNLEKKSKTTKKENFPDFWDGDYEYYHLIEIAQNLGLHMVIGKKRRGGYSFKAGSIAAKEYKIVRKSFTLMTAFDNAYLLDGDGLMQKALDNVNFINEHTDWARRKLINRGDEIKDGYIEKNEDGIEIIRGFQSTIKAISFGKGSGAAIGKDANIIFIDEAGRFKGLKTAVVQTQKTMTDGVLTTGFMVIFGTGGGQDTDFEDFADIFYSPSTYRCLEIINKWDKGLEGTTCGYFIPTQRCKPGFIDIDGNSLEDEAYEYEVKRRKTFNDVELVQESMAEPFNPLEAFKRSIHNFFPVEELESHLRYIQVYKLTNDCKNVDLYINGNGKIESKLSSNNPINNYPHSAANNLDGCVTIYQEPIIVDGSIPKNLYILCNDSYLYGDSKSKESLGVSYIIMNPNNVTSTNGNMIVASYIGRPSDVDDYNKNMFLLAQKYNAKIGLEAKMTNAVDYAKRFKLLSCLLEPAEMAFEEKVKKQNNNQGYGIALNDSVTKMIGLGYIRDWLLSVRYIDNNGNKYLNLHTIKDVGLLEELIKYRADTPTKKYNFDRISALIIGMYYMRELAYNNITIKQPNKQKNLISLLRNI